MSNQSIMEEQINALKSALTHLEEMALKYREDLDKSGVEPDMWNSWEEEMKHALKGVEQARFELEEVYAEKEQECDLCLGSGYVDEDDCPECHGAGVFAL